jgi:hypothetical protein
VALPIELWSIRESATAYIGIGAHLGSARLQNAKGHVLGHLGRNAEKDPTVRPHQTNERTDSYDIVAAPSLADALANFLSSDHTPIQSPCRANT